MQDMLDIDIRTEVATVIGDVNEFTSLMSDLPAIDFDSSSNDGDSDLWLGGPKWSAPSEIYADVGACINPNSIHSSTSATITASSAVLNSQKAQLNLNVHNYQSTNPPMASPKEKKSHLTFSPNTIKVPVVQETKKQSSLLCQTSLQQHQRSTIDMVKRDLTDDIKDEKPTPKQNLTNAISAAINNSNNSNTNNNNNSTASTTNTIKLAAGIGGLTFANSLMYAKLKQTNGKIVSNGNLSNLKRDSSPHRQQSSNSLINSNGTLTTNGMHHQNNPQKIFSRSIIVQNNNKTSNITVQSQQQQNQHHHPQQHLHNHQQISLQTNGITKLIKAKVTTHEFPKPAYSYSCLIAMALKNSRAGSLPVSEIYSFMCEHFPYFKTAPNGWKNSVRHNLSLNKCFEKIEKPATNGGQRKGCLWAMNPTKITKMDEEIQKWSRKDPMAIRKAMVYPENLDMLERGEMKHGSTGDSEGENEGEDTEGNSDSEQDVEMDDTVVNATEVESGEDDDPNSQLDYEIEVSNFKIFYF